MNGRWECEIQSTHVLLWSTQWYALPVLQQRRPKSEVEEGLPMEHEF